MQADKLRWWSIYREPEHELVGRIQLYIIYTTAADENNMKVQMLKICHPNIKYRRQRVITLFDGRNYLLLSSYVLIHSRGTLNNSWRHAS